MKPILASIATAVVLLSTPAQAEPAIKVQPVQFKQGASGTTIKAQIKGEQIIDYTLRAAAGQTMVVRFKPGNPSAYFNVLPPGSSGEAIFVGSSAGNDFSSELAASGEYTLRVYLMRNAARRNATAKYTLDISVTGTPRQ
ncbi:hypothetical protein OPU71_08980 [Niveibacterium sp. 24ML]|uniref:hypothetical protein n=1 Tax=Niveibacterium sp. 24ML TaxID=2985512 RepID=UPI00226E9BCD|nr:hypothetical protein [Niveibacterium sp. 24ML]MCX9156253.1 hypothetical protein [Niveibacterium sp. 24ML]